MPMGETGEEAVCVVVIQGALDPSWADYLGDLAMVTQVADDRTVSTFLSGQVVDFAAFVGLIGRVQNLGLPVQAISFQRLAAKPSGAEPQHDATAW